MQTESTAEQLKVEIKENFRLKNQLENNRKEYQETYKDVREELKELKKENEELLQEKINNQKIIVLAQNDMLNYQAGFEDGKNGRTSAVACVVENQQYYIIKKEIEHYKEYIEKLQKENEELKNKLLDTLEGQKVIKEETPQYIKENYILKEKVKEKIEEEKLPLTIVGGRKNKKTLEYGIKLGRRQALQELIEERKVK